MALLLLCGAVPVTDLMIEGPDLLMLTDSTSERLIICCCCHRTPPPPPVPQPVQQPEIRLPDLIPSCHESETPAKSRLEQVQPDELRQVAGPADETDDSKISTREWRQIGHDLRLIADRFQLERTSRDSLSTQSHWIWSAVIQTAAIYIGWRLHRWATGGA